MKPVIFAGPSIYGLNIGNANEFDWLPPAACGDILKVTIEGRKTIGLIDGTFEAGPAVWHKEILFALENGVSVWGAASMGALRAAECHSFGMIGIGRIFRQYLSGERFSDADVAVSYAPSELGYQPLSIAQIEVDHILDEMLAKTKIQDTVARHLKAVSKKFFFKDRTWDAILQASYLPDGERRSLHNSIKSLGPTIKVQDAAELLSAIAQIPTSSNILKWPNQTTFFTQLRKSMAE